ncbi:HIT domain-containing protein [Curvivirga sp.]|uniref:HIT domain-containing protein n=1 Tax=Curvivirga sp. TaxID=2856848 RepID=UPI003B5AFA74
MFQLHPRLEADTVHVMDLPLSRVLLLKDARYPWVVLVPQRPNLKEIHQLNDEDGIQLWREMRVLSEFMEKNFDCQKVNVAALGNMVPQLHVHIIAREEEDFAWPKPVWAIGDAEEYDDQSLRYRIELLKQGLGNAF